MIFKILALALDNSILFQTLNKLILASYKQEDTDFMFKGSIYLSLDTLLKMILFFFFLCKSYGKNVNYYQKIKTCLKKKSLDFYFS